MATLLINNKKVKPGKLPLIGEGGQGKVYDLDKVIPGRVLKVLKQPRDYNGPGSKQEKELAKERLAILPKRLKLLPELPPRVIVPEGLVRGSEGEIAALVFPRIDGAFSLTSITELSWREDRMISQQRVVQIFSDIHHTLSEIHKKDVVVGDLKPDNILVCHNAAFFIDVEGYGVGKYQASGYSPDYVDPSHCTLASGDYRLEKALTANSDWFSFTSMLFQCLYGIAPYGGTLRRASTKGEEKRPFSGLSVLSNRVRVPKRISLRGIPQDLKTFFVETFSHNRREAFPIELLQSCA